MRRLRLPALLAATALGFALLPATASAAPTTLQVDPVTTSVPFSTAFQGELLVGYSCSGLVDGTSQEDAVFLSADVSHVWGNGEYPSSASGSVPALCDGDPHTADLSLAGGPEYEILSGSYALTVVLRGPNDEQYGQPYHQTVTVTRSDDASPTPAPSSGPSTTPAPTPKPSPGPPTPSPEPSTPAPTPTPSPTPSPTPTQPPAPVKASVSLTTNASPETVVKGKKITVKGTIKRDGKKYKARTVLQFAADGDSFHKVKTVKASGKGALKATVTASTSGSFRYTFPGNATTRSGASASDHIVVKPKPKPRPKPKAYKNCTALVKVYPHGVGRSGAKDKGGDVTDFTRDDKTYAKNKKSDRDKDGIACER